MKNYTLLWILLFSASFEVHAQGPQLWGTASFGGGSGLGSIMKINGDGSGFSRVYSFFPPGVSPWSNLLPINNTSTYGTTVAGGSHLLGDIYSLDFSTNTYTPLHSFDSIGGYYPRGSLLRGSDGKLYGLTQSGGTHNWGTLFSFDPSNNFYTKLHDFDSTGGKVPFGSVVQQGNNLYGMTTSGGTSFFGVIFKYDIVNNTFSVVHNFGFIDGANPFGSLIVASDNKLYGMTFGGGITGFGVIFSFDPSNNTLTVVHNFEKTNGSAPLGGLVQASNGMMYGMTQQGGTTNEGVLFSFDPANSVFTKLHDFTQATGSKPSGNVIVASDGNLYGMTVFGGLSDLGAIFSFNLQSNQYADLHDCNLTDGGFPQADLIEYNFVTGIEELTINNDMATIYPNPSSGKIAIHLNDTRIGKVNVKVSDLYGRAVKEFEINKSDISIDLKVAAGIYIISLSNNKEKMNCPLVIE